MNDLFYTRRHINLEDIDELANDDNADIRAKWIEKGGVAIEPNENLFTELAKLIS